MTDVIDGDAIEIGTDLEVHTGGPVTLFGTADPNEALAKAAEVATALQGVLTSAKLTTRIGSSKKPYVLAEGWTCLGSLMGIFPRTVWTRKLENGYEARVEAVTRDGAVVGAAEAECTRDERNWASRDAYALRSMAQTRAMGKALRMPLGFIVVLAGYEATPADEMPHDEPPQPPTRQAATPGDVMVNFGKYKGQTIQEIADHDRQYVGWLGEKSQDPVVAEAAKLFLRDEDVPF